MHDKNQKENDEKGKENAGKEKESETRREKDGTSVEEKKSVSKEIEKKDDAMNKSAICHFCEREFQSTRGLGVHLRRMHNADQQENREKGKRKYSLTLSNTREGEERRSEKEIPDGKEKCPKRTKEKIPSKDLVPLIVKEKVDERVMGKIPTDQVKKTDTRERQERPSIEKDKVLVKANENRKLVRWNKEDTESLVEKEIELLKEGFKGFINVELAKRMGNKFTNIEVKARRQYIGHKILLKETMEYVNSRGKIMGKADEDRKERDRKEREKKRVEREESGKEWYRKRMSQIEKEREEIENETKILCERREAKLEKEREEHEKKKEEERARRERREKEEKEEEERKGKEDEPKKEYAVERIKENIEKGRNKNESGEREMMSETITISEEMDESWHTAEKDVKEEPIDMEEKNISVRLMNPENEIEDMWERIRQKCKKEEKREEFPMPKVAY
ncbi:hypothetical protein SNEBB_000270, partial [Seison nebaliae]